MIQVLDAPEILEVIHEIPFLESFLQSLYHCRYAEFFTALGMSDVWHVRCVCCVQPLSCLNLVLHSSSDATHFLLRPCCTTRRPAHIEGYLKADRFLHAHYRWYTREMRIIAYAQLLESYRSLSIESMAKSFGVSGEFIDR